MRNHWNRLVEGVMNAIIDWFIGIIPGLLSWAAHMGIVIVLTLLLLAACIALSPMRPGG